MPQIDDPDTWWDTLPLSRKQQIARWISGGHEPAPESPDQMALDDEALGIRA